VVVVVIVIVAVLIVVVVVVVVGIIRLVWIAGLVTNNKWKANCEQES
jgi:hypothetical protein